MASSAAMQAPTRILIMHNMFVRTEKEHFVRENHVHMQPVWDALPEYQSSTMFCSEMNTDTGSPQEEMGAVPLAFHLIK